MVSSNRIIVLTLLVFNIYIETGEVTSTDHVSRFNLTSVPNQKLIPTEIFKMVRLDTFRYNIEYLTKYLGIRALNTDQNRKAKIWIEESLQSFNSKSIKTEIVGSHESVIGILLGRKHNESNKIVVIGAHFDTVPTSKGANDNAGGVSLVLEAARVLSAYSYNFTYDIYFVAFNGEEQALYGSWEVSNYLKQDHDVILCLNADMILFNDPTKPEDQKQGIFYKGDDVLRSKAKYEEWGNLSVRISNELGEGYCYTGPTDVLHSDHGPFWHAGFPALFANSGRDSQYHQIGDTLNNPELNLTYSLETVSTFTTVAALTAEFGEDILIMNDSDKDGLDSQLEMILGTSDNSLDTDRDGFPDVQEYLNGWNPIDPNNPQTTNTTSINSTTLESDSLNEDNISEFRSFFQVPILSLYLIFYWRKKKLRSYNRL
ncbi:MAG: M28 family metallopeptidase [Candidatus Kariarchaeaceae archaeon]